MMILTIVMIRPASRTVSEREMGNLPAAKGFFLFFVLPRKLESPITNDISDIKLLYDARSRGLIYTSHD